VIDVVGQGCGSVEKSAATTANHFERILGLLVLSAMDRYFLVACQSSIVSHAVDEEIFELAHGADFLVHI